MSSAMSDTSLNVSGTSPAAMRCARPSTSAVCRGRGAGGVAYGCGVGGERSGNSRGRVPKGVLVEMQGARGCGIGAEPSQALVMGDLPTGYEGKGLSAHAAHCVFLDMDLGGTECAHGQAHSHTQRGPCVPCVPGQGR